MQNQIAKKWQWNAKLNDKKMTAQNRNDKEMPEKRQK